MAPAQHYAEDPSVPWEPATGLFELTKVAPLLAKRGARAFNLTPAVGTEIHGVKLSELTQEEVNELYAVLLTRGVVFFRDQNDLDVQGQKELGQKFAQTDNTHAGLHIHPFGRGLPDHPEVLTIESRPLSKQIERTGLGFGTVWHADVTFDKRPPSISILRIEKVPDNGGGDTLFLHAGKLYAALPEPYKSLLTKLQVRHDGKLFREQAKEQRNLPKEQQVKAPQYDAFPVTEEEWEEKVVVHPAVRTHPVTGEQVLYVNPNFAKQIIGLSKDESDSILQFLFNQLNARVEFQARFKWARPNSVAIWDNRVVQHSIIFDVYPLERRGYRVTVSGAEDPFYSPEGVPAKV